MALRVRLHWCREAPFPPPLAQVAATRVGTGGLPGENSDGIARKFVIDFVGGQLNDTPAEAPVQAVVGATGGAVTDPIARKNEMTGGWHVFFDLQPDGSDPVEMRCRLQLADKPLSETWVCRWTLRNPAAVDAAQTQRSGEDAARLALPRVIGHRGAAAAAPENTLASIAKAKALGASWIEFDVKLTEDGHAVLFHDDRLERTTDGRAW